MYLREGEEKQ